MTNDNNEIVKKISEDMQRLPVELRKAIRPKLQQAANLVMTDAKQRASWSGRIPGSIKVRASFRVDREGVMVVAGGKNAPHARLYEAVSGHAYFRHPVFGNRNKWVSQATRPFLFPAARAHENATNDAMLQALADAASEIGFKG